MAAPHPTARRRATSRLPRSPSRPRKRHENPPSGADRHHRLRPPAPDTPSEQSIGRRVRRHAQRRSGLCRTGHSQPSARPAPETQNRFGRAGGAGRPACAAGTTQRSALQIAADRAEDGDPISPDPNTKIRAKSAISTAQGEAQQPEHGASEQWPRRRSAREAGWRATHQPHPADEHNHACAPPKLPHGSSPAAPGGGGGPLRPPTPQAQRDRTAAARCAEDHRGFRRPDRPRTLPPLPRYVLPAPPHLPTARIRSQKGRLPLLRQ
jgi:hypothetical protein